MLEEVSFKLAKSEGFMNALSLRRQVTLTKYEKQIWAKSEEKGRRKSVQELTRPQLFVSSSVAEMNALFFAPTEEDSATQSTNHSWLVLFSQPGIDSYTITRRVAIWVN